MTLDTEDTIAAVASAAGGAARGIVRVSGPGTLACVSQCFHSTDDRRIEDNVRPSMVAGEIRLTGIRPPLPCDLYLWPTTRSYTRQPLAELHTFGSPPLLSALVRTLCEHGARPAEPGEFTLRAFLAGRLDLTQAEAVLGVIDAKGGGELDAALSQLAGGLSGPLHALRENLLGVLAHLEAGLDFVEEDIEFISPGELDAQLAAAEQAVREIESQMHQRSETHDAVTAVLWGLPNTGKSSLFNALVERYGRGAEIALVSDTSGTTRDFLTAELDLSGLPCTLVDTAGVDDAGHPDEIARAAQRMTSEQQTRAAIRLLCLDASRERSAWEQEAIDAAGEETAVVLTKCDLTRAMHGTGEYIETSAVTGQGIERLVAAVQRSAEQTVGGDGNIVGCTAVRCRESLRRAGDSLHEARTTAAAELGEELVAAEIRAALDELGKVVGAVYTDDILDRVFSRFCIGK